MEPVPSEQPTPDFMQNPPPAAKPEPELALTEGADSDLGIALGVGKILEDNPWAPLVMLALAGIGVLGGKKAWSFYSERGAQKHELELKKLDIQEKQAKHQQPPACLLRDAEHDTKFATLETRLSSLETKLSGVEKSIDLGDLDLEDFKRFDRRLKKLEKSVKELDTEDKE